MMLMSVSELLQTPSRTVIASPAKRTIKYTAQNIILLFQHALQFGERRLALCHQQETFFLKWPHAGSTSHFLGQIELWLFEQHLAHFVVYFQQLEQSRSTLKADRAAFFAWLLDLFR